MNSKVDFFFEKPSQWQEEYKLLRSLALDCNLTEELKWGKPCYTLNNSNVLLIHGFKEYCALLFHKGALLNDEQNLLIQQTENVQAARQLRFTSYDQIQDMQDDIKAYIKDAIRVEKADLKVEMKKTAEYEMPEELQEKLNADSELEEAFYNLTPGRQRGYLLYFSQAKQAKTRVARIEKYIPHILTGKGFND